jgi:hypothetical protein
MVEWHEIFRDEMGLAEQPIVSTAQGQPISPPAVPLLFLLLLQRVGRMSAA